MVWEDIVFQKKTHQMGENIFQSKNCDLEYVKEKPYNSVLRKQITQLKLFKEFE